MNWQQVGKLADALTEAFAKEGGRYSPEIAVENSYNGPLVRMSLTFAGNFIPDFGLKDIDAFVAQYSQAYQDGHPLAFGVTTDYKSDKVYVVFFEPGSGYGKGNTATTHRGYEDIPF